jgi:hypothetical protein
MRNVNARASATPLALSMGMMAAVKRFAWNTLAALSFLLCLASIVLWLRSYWYRDILSFGHAGGNCHVVQSLLGRIHILSNLDGGCSGGFSYSGPHRLSPQAIWNGGMSGYPVNPKWHAGFIWQRYSQWQSWRSWARPDELRLIVIPYGCPALLLATPPALWLVRRSCGRRRHRSAAGLCPECGYDMRATPRRCPECGCQTDQREPPATHRPP